MGPQYMEFWLWVLAFSTIILGFLYKAKSEELQKLKRKLSKAKTEVEALKAEKIAGEQKRSWVGLSTTGAVKEISENVMNSSCTISNCPTCSRVIE